MCLRCDGYSEEDVHRAVELTIATHGWAVQGVQREPPDTGSEWAYSVGLAESYGLQELVVTGLSFTVGARLVNAAAELLIEGFTLDEIDDELGLRHGVVHPRRVEGDWVAMWCNYYGRLPENGLFVQLFAPPEMFCSCHRHQVPDLTDPGPVDRPGTRAARRRAERERRRRYGGSGCNVRRGDHDGPSVRSSSRAAAPVSQPAHEPLRARSATAATPAAFRSVP